MIAEYVVTALLSASTPQLDAQAHFRLTADTISQPVGAVATTSDNGDEVAHDDESPKETMHFAR